MSKSTRDSFLIIVPVLDDWESLGLLLGRLDAALALAKVRAAVLAVDDGSVQNACDHLHVDCWQAISQVSVLRLRRNLGHQRAIAVALAFAEANLAHEAVIVMDSDGEDRPEHVPLLITEHGTGNPPRIIFGLRSKRSEGLLFCIGYAVYRALFYLATGRSIRFGNFSLVPWSLLPRLVALSELWNHYSAALIKERLPRTTLPLERGHRLAGQSRMNLVSLCVHGLSAISVYSEVVGTRMMLFSGVMAGFGLLAAASVVCIRLATDWSIPGWATAAFGLATIAVLQALGMGFFFAIIVLHARSAQAFLPMRDHAHFVLGCETLEPSAPRAKPAACA